RGTDGSGGGAGRAPGSEPQGVRPPRDRRIYPPGDRGDDRAGGRNLQGAPAPRSTAADGEAEMNEEPMSEHPDLQEYFEAPYGDVPHDVRAHLQGCAECARELSAL